MKARTEDRQEGFQRLNGGTLKTDAQNGVLYDPPGWVSLKWLESDTNTYDIELSRCNTDAKILSWVLHLMQKTWVTEEMLGSFVRVCRTHHKLPWVSP